MAGTTIGGTHANLTLTSPGYLNPIYITGTVTGTNAAVEGLTPTSWTLVNSGMIAGTTTGIHLEAGGRITNQATGSISGGQFGVYVADIQGTVVNAGGIQGGGTSASAGVQLASGGSVANQSGGTISGFAAIAIQYSAGTVVNDGTLTGSGAAAIILYNGGTITNHASALITGATNGINGKSGATLFNAGTIEGGSTNAGVYFPGGGIVSNQTGGVIDGVGAGVEIFGSGNTVDNAGRIGASSAGGHGITTSYGGYVTNRSSGVISGVTNALQIYGGAGTVINAGTIVATTTTAVGPALILLKGGTVTNQAGALISGPSGVTVYQAPATITNDGRIITTDDGINVSFGGVVTNGADGTISGYNGIYIGNDATVINAGTITGSGPAQRAVYFGAGYTHRAIVDPGAVFNGRVEGGNSVGSTATSTLEFASAASIIGTLAALGSRYIDFAQVTIDGNAAWAVTGTNQLESGVTFTNSGSLTLKNAATFADYGVLANNGAIRLGQSTLTAASLLGNGTLTIGAAGTVHAQGTVAAGQALALGGAGARLRIDSPLLFAGTIDGFVVKRTIELTGVAHASTDGAHITGTNTLEVTTGSGTFDLQLDPSQDFTGKAFDLSANGGGTDITVACFAAGTRIATDGGSLPVETLREGDVVRTLLRGRRGRIIWLGHRRIDCRRHRDPGAVWPIRVLGGALAVGCPARDLYLSPDHALLIDGVLVPVRHLVNGQMIVQQACDTITYWHLELADHDVIFAEGVAAESYLDTGNRAAFDGETRFGVAARWRRGG